MDVAYIAKLANIPISSDEIKVLAIQFADTIKTIDLINELDTTSISPTSQVTGLENVTRPDNIDPSRILTQTQVLSQCHRTYHGYIVVPAIFE